MILCFVDAESFTQGRKAFEKGNYEAALQLYSQALEETTNEFDLALVYCNLGAANYMSGNYEDAIAACNQSIAINPDDAKAYICRGAACAKLGDHRRAAQDEEKARWLDRDRTDHDDDTSYNDADNDARGGANNLVYVDERQSGNGGIFFFLAIAAACVFGYYAYSAYTDRANIEAAIRDNSAVKIKSFSVDNKITYGDGTINYFFHGILENGVQFQAYAQISKSNSGLQMRYGNGGLNTTLCSGMFVNAMVSFCAW
jgi:tetratricopeptide (TPR) repeat protein